MLNVTLRPAILNTTLDPLLHNMTCDVPHDDQDKVYTYTLTSGFVGFSTFIAVVNFLLVIPTALSNLFIILGISRRTELLTNPNRLLVSLCMADFIIGVLVQPIFGAHIIQVTKASHQCTLSLLLVYVVPVTIVITMVTHMIISLERYFSVHYPKTHTKVFSKAFITGFIIVVWIACLLSFVIPLITGKVVLGTRIIVCLILLSLAICSYCYISIYQDAKQKHSKMKVEFKGKAIIKKTETVERTPEETAAFESNMKIAVIFAKLFACMVVIYVMTLVKYVLNAYDVFPGNGYYTMHFLFDTILFLNALLNPILIMYLSVDIFSAASMVL